MKMTRTKLKGLVKECLVEILSEGIKTNEISLQEKRNHQDRQRQEESRLAEHRAKFESRVDNTVSALTDDNMMQSILADTAKTTLQEQSNHDSTPSGIKSSDSPGIDLGSIFQESSDNWSKLAFPLKKG